MKIRTFDDIKGFILSEFSGGTLQIATGAFGANQQFEIDQQDGALEISQNGKLLWSSAGGPHLRPKSISSDRPFTPDVTEILRRADAAAAERGLHFVDSIVLLLGMINGEGWEKSYAADLIAESGNVKIMRDRASSIAGTTGWKEARVTEESAAPESEDPGVRELDETSAPKTFEKKHEWDDRPHCRNCGMEWNSSYEHDACSGEDAGSRALTQLGGCLLAAEGCATGTNDAVKGDYGWSPAFQAVKDLRAEGDRLRMSLEHCRQATLENFDPDSLPATADEGVELHSFVAIRELRERYDAERAANADKVQTIYRQCQERRTFCEIFERLPAEIRLWPEIAALREKLEGVQEPSAPIPLEAGEGLLQTKEGDLKVVKLDDLELQAKHHYLKWVVGQIEREAKGTSDGLQGTGKAAFMAVTMLALERNRLRSTIPGLREKVLAHLPCVCSQNRSICHRHEIEETLDDFERQAGVAEAEGPERDDVTSTAEEKAPGPCDPERIKDKLVIRFDSLPGPEPAGFVETELNGKGIRAGEWIQDGEYWLLVIRPDVIPPKKRPGDLASRRCEHILALIVERDWLKKSYAKARIEVLARTMCTCPQGGIRWEKAHEPTCRLGVALTEFPESP